MDIITEPKVYLVGSQTINDAALDRFLGDHDVDNWETDTDEAGEKLVEVAGRCCYMSFAKPRPGGNRAYIEHILEVGHGSVLEHAVFNLIITGVSRSFTHELVRHRAGMGYSQLSQRFVDESSCAFVEPPIIADDPVLHAIWLEAVGAAQTAYTELSNHLFDKLKWAEYSAWERSLPDDTASNGSREWWDSKSTEFKTSIRKQAREAARSVMPNATETKIFVTGNARALRHLIEMRGSVGADAEIRRVAIAMLKLLNEASPNLFGDYEVLTADGVEYVSTPFKKV